MEYQIYEAPNSKIPGHSHMQLSNRGPELIKLFNEKHSDSDVVLMPEFGGWMVEAVPKNPYNSTLDAAELLSCEDKLHKRRAVLDEYF